MKFISATILTALLGLCAAFILPWWGIVLAAFIGAMSIKQKALPSFFAGFFGIFILWTLWSLRKNGINEGILGARMSNIMGLNSTYLLILLGAVLGGFVSGLAAFCGHIFRNLFEQKSKPTRRSMNKYG
jgi:hypothetical protein